MRKSRLRAIKTRYKNHAFRSRLEARYAVYFDSLGIRWTYEPEGFELGNGLRYLPDFWLPDWGLWVEIKPDAPDAASFEKAKRLSENHYSLIMFCGEPRACHTDTNMFFGWMCGDSSAGYMPGIGAGFFAHVDGELALGIDRSSSKIYYPCENLGETESLLTFDTSDKVSWTAAENAVTAALSARFEFGEKGGVE